MKIVNKYKEIKCFTLRDMLWEMFVNVLYFIIHNYIVGTVLIYCGL